MFNLKRKVFAIVLILVCLLVLSSNVLATNTNDIDNSNRQQITINSNTSGTINTNTENTQNTNTNNNNNNNVSTYTNDTTLPDTGIDYSILIIITLFAISTIFAYTKIKKYRM